MSETVTGAIEKVDTAVTDLTDLQCVAHPRDIPRNCICGWVWAEAAHRYVRPLADPDCPWHLEEVIPR